MKRNILGAIALCLFVLSVGTTAHALTSEEREAKKLEREAQAQERAQVKAENQEARSAQKLERETQREEKKLEREAVKDDRFCQKSSDHISKISEKIDSRGSKTATRFAAHTTKMQEMRARKLNTLLENRANADTRRAEHYAELEARATTQEQIQAFATYKSAVELAAKTRRDNVDTLFATFWDSAESALADHEEAYSEDYEKFARDVKSITESAETDCADSDSVADTAKDLRAQLKVLLGDFRESRTQKNDVKQEITTLRAAYTSAMRSGAEEFRVAVKSARDVLQSAFGVAE